MTIHLKKFALTVLTVGGISLGSLTLMTPPASAHVVCDDDGDDCWRTHPYYGRDWDWRDRDYDWHERREWEERRRWDAYRRRYWEYRGYPYGWGRGYSGG